ncbi:MAG: FMN-binding protein [Gammaproteobacteria bacterium]|nr:FMN-binding protein [Gammaproteobacteria bacterium]
MRRLLAIVLLSLAGSAHADQVYQAPQDFVAEAFGGAVPEPQPLWIGGGLREQATAILGHDPGYPRMRYWRAGERTAWVLEEIGKERPITVGFVVEADRLQRVKILVYRESRGGEVRLPAFMRQFEGARLIDNAGLDREIHNISGATLSVNALRRLAAVALLFHRHATA